MQQSSYIIRSIALLLTVVISLGMGNHVLGQPTFTSATFPEKPDSTSLLHAFKKGSLGTGWRYYFMATDNGRTLTDYYAHALGVHAKYETASFKKLNAGIGGSFTGKILSTDLSAPDSLTKSFARYEIGLFDMEDLSSPTVKRLEELYLSYHNKDLTLTAGRQLLNTPFINLQDGRMRPTAVSGIYLKNAGVKTIIEGGYIQSILPRSSGSWFGIGSSIGLYPQGMNPDGSPADYAGHLHSGGVVLLGVSHNLHPDLKIQAWDQLVSDIFNTLLLQADWTHNQDSLSGIRAGIQLVMQQRVGNGGNASEAHAFFKKDNHPLTISSHAGWFNPHWDLSLNYTRITRSGQYLMPREWGKDPFFSFLPRERNSGSGGLDAWVTKITIKEPKHSYSLSLDGGYFRMPGLDDFRLNRYGMPSYYQLNLEFKHRFQKWPRGLVLQLLYVYKKQAGTKELEDRYVFNKVNMSSYNVVLNYSL